MISLIDHDSSEGEQRGRDEIYPEPSTSETSQLETCFMTLDRWPFQELIY